jgi:hypothetical protein
MWTHEHKVCKKRPDYVAVSRRGSNGPLKPKTAKALAALGQAAAESMDRAAHLCNSCPFRARAAERSLFEQLVRQGLDLDGAMATMAKAKAVFAG